MKRGYVLFTGIAIVITAGLALVSPPRNQVSAAADQSPSSATSVKQLLERLKTQSRSGTIMFGQQHATDESITLDSRGNHMSDVKALTGRYPAVFGYDFSEEPGDPRYTTAQNGKTYGAAIRKAAELGAITTFTDHMPNFATGGDSWDAAKNHRIDVKRLLKGGDLNHKLNARLDVVIATAKNAKRADGSTIPFIYRPLHEHNGDWFWWGAHNYTNHLDFAYLWRYIVDYIRQGGANNVAFAYSPNGHFGDYDYKDSMYLRGYPGNKYVDIMGYDVYQGGTDVESDKSISNAKERAKISDAEWIDRTVKDLRLVTYQAYRHGKIAAFCEFGYNEGRVIQRSGNLNTQFFKPLIDKIKASGSSINIAYMMTWANWSVDEHGKFQAYTPWPNHEMAADFKAFAQQVTLSKY